MIVFSRLLGRKRRAGDAGHRQAVPRVGAPFQSGDAVLGLAHGGEHEGGNRAPAAQVLGEVQAAFPGHHQIEHDQIEGERVELGARVGHVAGGGDQEAVLAQELAQKLPQAVVVVHHQNVRNVGVHPQYPLS